MTRSQIEYILAVDRLKNFGKAAEDCFITQSTLSALVAKFEAQIGIAIFNRKTRPISTTVQGEKLIQKLKNINREYQLLDEQINEIKGVETGKISLACIPTVAPYLYPLILNDLSKKYPNVNFDISEMTTEMIVQSIIAGDLDLGIVSTPLEHPSLLEYPIYQEEFLLYDCGNKTKNSKYQISDIDIDRLWLMEEGHCMRNQVGKICELRQQKNINGNLSYNCGSIFTLIEMVKRNKGITLIPKLATVSNHQIKKNNVFHFDGVIPSREIGIITHKNYLKNNLLNHMIKKIHDAVEKYLQADEKELNMVSPF